MKLLYITNGITGAGGLERVLSIKASFLAEEYGYDVSILTLNEPNSKTFFNFSQKIHFLSIEVAGHPLTYIYSYVYGVRKVIQKIQPDIISVCDDGLKGFFIPIILKTKIPIIYERHVSKLIDTRSGQKLFSRALTQTKWMLMEKLAKRFSRFIVLTEGNKKEWTSLTNLDVIPNPLSFYPAERSSLDQKKVISVGKISYQKGQDLLVDAWDIIIKKYPDWQLLLYGKGNIDYLDTNQLKSKNIFHFPPVKNIMEEYLNSSIYVMSSRFEGFGMVLIEAMACGLPCVSFNCDYGPSDIITHREDGLLASAGNVYELAKQLEVLMDDYKLREVMGGKAKKNSIRFAQETVMIQWHKLFNDLTANHTANFYDSNK